MLIDCDTCTARGTGCADCVVTVLLGAPPGWQGVDPVVVPMTARRAGAGDRRPRGRPPRRTSSCRRRAWSWSSTTSSAARSGRWPSRPRAPVATPRRGRPAAPVHRPMAPPDGLTGFRDRPVRLTVHTRDACR